MGSYISEFGNRKLLTCEMCEDCACETLGAMISNQIQHQIGVVFEFIIQCNKFYSYFHSVSS